MEGDYKFSKYQWIKAEIKKASDDARPESYNIRDESIKLGEMIYANPNGWLEREKWLLTPKNLYNSVEALNQARKENATSLGVVKPKEIISFQAINKTKKEMEEIKHRKKSIMDQLDMLREKKDLELLPVRFTLKFLCDEPECQGHKLSILDWEIGELYRKVKDNSDWKEKIRHKVMDDICGAGRETYLILGNMALHQHVFCILGFFWPPKKRQLKLF